MGFPAHDSLRLVAVELDSTRSDSETKSLRSEAVGGENQFPIPSPHDSDLRFVNKASRNELAEGGQWTLTRLDTLAQSMAKEENPIFGLMTIFSLFIQFRRMRNIFIC